MSRERHQQVMELFDEAMERPAETRAALLDERCQADAELRQAVEKMLAAHERCSPAFMQESAIEIQARQLALSDQPLEPGATLAQFTIMSPLGSGAMGDVYLARDTRLDRKVALKVLPTRFTWDASRLRRFEREARSASALNHQNIITIYDFGSAETEAGTRYFIAAEYVEGVTLRTKLKDGALPIAEALDIAQQIATALESAHAAGIIHRDIKPENVMIRPDGVVKVLDFGIAKLNEANGVNAATTHRSTEQGMVIGTPGYMSPEQARGLEVDARTDIFSFGVVLYEMIAGQLPFIGATNADVVVSLLEKEPTPLSKQIPNIPVNIDKLILYLLAKNCEDRLQSSTQLCHTLKGFSDSLTGLASKGKTSLDGKLRYLFVNADQFKALRNSRNILKKISLAFFAIFLSFSAYIYYFTNKINVLQSHEVINWRPSLLHSEKLGPHSVISHAVFSPQGDKIVFSIRGRRANEAKVLVQKLGVNEIQVISDGKWEDHSPIWSPDGKAIAFVSNRNQKRGIWIQAYPDGSPALLKESDTFITKLVGWTRGNKSERIYFAVENRVYMYDFQFKVVKQVFESKLSAGDDVSLSPDEAMVAFSALVDGVSQIFTHSLQNKKTTQLTYGSSDCRFPIWFAGSSQLAFITNVRGVSQVNLSDLSGKIFSTQVLGSDYFDLSMSSPDGGKIIGVTQKEYANIWSYNIAKGEERQHTSEFKLQLFPALSPNGEHLVFQAPQSSVGWNDDVFIKKVMGQGGGERVSYGFNPEWSPDGKMLTFLRLDSGKTNIWALNGPLNGGSEQQLTKDGIVSRGFEMTPYNLLSSNFQWSMDASKIVYVSKQVDRENIWQYTSETKECEMLTNNDDSKVKICCPFYSPGGTMLAYRTSMGSSSSGNLKISLHLLEKGKSELIFSNQLSFRIIGWSANGEEIILAWEDLKKAEGGGPKVKIAKFSVRNRLLQYLSELSDADLYSVKISPDYTRLAFIHRHGGKDNVGIVNLGNGSTTTVTSNNDQDVFFACPVWAPDNKTIFYSKQKSWFAISVLEKN